MLIIELRSVVHIQEFVLFQLASCGVLKLSSPTSPMRFVDEVLKVGCMKQNDTTSHKFFWPLNYFPIMPMWSGYPKCPIMREIAR